MSSIPRSPRRRWTYKTFTLERVDDQVMILDQLDYLVAIADSFGQARAMVEYLLKN